MSAQPTRRRRRVLALPMSRYDITRDPSLIMAEIMEWGDDSARGREAMRRMNRFHGRYKNRDIPPRHEAFEAIRVRDGGNSFLDTDLTIPAR